jgi:EpsI family protein
LLAWLVDVAVIQQLALVAILICGVWAIVGHSLARRIAFPLLFLFLAVPMGEGLIAPMMEFTASSTVWLIEVSGIPVYREGLNFALPSGRWSVVEACSGVRYIIASVTVGVLYAYLTYRSWSRRIIFVLVAAIVPIFANTVRAYIIVMLGHFSGMTIATGADHLVYGWVFFGLVIFVLFWLGAFFREDDLDDSRLKTAARAAGGLQQASYASVLLTALGALCVASLAPILAHTALDNSQSQTNVSIQFPGAGQIPPDEAGNVWQWAPLARVAGLQSAYYALGGQTVGLFLQYADGSTPGADVIGSSALFTPEDSGWLVTMQDQFSVQTPDGPTLVDEARLRGSKAELLAWSWYVVGDSSTANDYRAKFAQTGARLGFGTTATFRVVIAVPVQTSVETAREQLQQAADRLLDPLYAQLRQPSSATP